MSKKTSKSEPCEFCQDTVKDTWEVGISTLMMEFYPENGLISFDLYTKDENGEIVDDGIESIYNYCPNCGRKLGYE